MCGNVHNQILGHNTNNEQYNNIQRVKQNKIEIQMYMET